MENITIEACIAERSDQLHRELLSSTQRHWLLLDPVLRPIFDETPLGLVLARRTAIPVPSAGDPDPSLMPLLVEFSSAKASDHDLLWQSLSEALEELAPERLAQGGGRRICGWLESGADRKRMTDFLPHPNADGLVKLSGTIRNLKVTRDTASFVFTETDRTKMGVIAIAAAIAGMGGQAMSTTSNASAMEEEADYLEFDLDGLLVKGWVWRCPFREGDVVAVAAERAGDHWEAYGVARSKDKTIALYPHCSRSRTRHVTNAAKSWLLWSAIFLLFIQFPIAILSIGFRIFGYIEFYFMLLALVAFFALMTWSLTRKWMPFVRLAEKVFRVLELPDPSNIDLVKSSKIQRTEQDHGEFGTFYFRY